MPHKKESNEEALQVLLTAITYDMLTVAGDMAYYATLIQQAAAVCNRASWDGMHMLLQSAVLVLLHQGYPVMLFVVLVRPLGAAVYMLNCIHAIRHRSWGTGP